LKQKDNIVIADDVNELADEFTRIFVELCEISVKESGRFTVALSGGSTPKILYRRLVSVKLPWNRVFFFFGDERCVPPDHSESNFRMASKTLLKPLSVPETRIFRWSTELHGPPDIAADYAERLRTFFGGVPRFDLCLLGLGADGHTASLFPDTKALNYDDSTSFAVSNWVPELQAYRITLTAAVINNSAEIVFVVAGREKAAALAAVIQGPHKPEKLPAQLIDPVDGRLRWLIDAPAASLLTP